MKPLAAVVKRPLNACVFVYVYVCVSVCVYVFAIVCERDANSTSQVGTSHKVFSL